MPSVIAPRSLDVQSRIADGLWDPVHVDIAKLLQISGVLRERAARRRSMVVRQHSTNPLGWVGKRVASMQQGPDEISFSRPCPRSSQKSFTNEAVYYGEKAPMMRMRTLWSQATSAQGLKSLQCSDALYFVSAEYQPNGLRQAVCL